ncbi:MAG TPA: hypothetical protein VG435_09385 [Acidimicrobiales bacterium]|nr:hypothetical protein [Acidimicrobiales bacterium]
MALPNWRPRQQSVTVRAASTRFGRTDLDRYLKGLGADGAIARDLDHRVDEEMERITALSALTSMLAVDYMERLTRPVPSLTPEIGVLLVGRTYVAHTVVEGDSGRFGAPDVPVLGTLPPLKKGRPPQDLMSRVVKVSRGRTFPPLCALSPAAWDGFVHCLTKRAHDVAPSDHDLIDVKVVDGVAAFAWVLRQVDLHYGLEPERR